MYVCICIRTHLNDTGLKSSCEAKLTVSLMYESEGFDPDQYFLWNMPM